MGWGCYPPLRHNFYKPLIWFIAAVDVQLAKDWELQSSVKILLNFS